MDGSNDVIKNAIMLLTVGGLIAGWLTEAVEAAARFNGTARMHRVEDENTPSRSQTEDAMWGVVIDFCAPAQN